MRTHKDGTLTRSNGGFLEAESRFSQHCMIISLIDGLVSTGCVEEETRPSISDVRDIMNKNGATIPGSNSEFEISGNSHDKALENFCMHYNTYVVVHRGHDDTLTGIGARYPILGSLNLTGPIRCIDVMWTGDGVRHFEYILFSPKIRLPGMMFQHLDTFEQIYESVESERRALTSILKKLGVKHRHILVDATLTNIPTPLFFIRCLPLGNTALMKDLLRRISLAEQFESNGVEDSDEGSDEDGDVSKALNVTEVKEMMDAMSRVGEMMHTFGKEESFMDLVKTIVDIMHIESAVKKQDFYKSTFIQSEDGETIFVIDNNEELKTMIQELRHKFKKRLARGRAT